MLKHLRSKSLTISTYDLSQCSYGQSVRSLVTQTNLLARNLSSKSYNYNNTTSIKLKKTLRHVANSNGKSSLNQKKSITVRSFSLPKRIDLKTHLIKLYTSKSALLLKTSFKAQNLSTLRSVIRNKLTLSLLWRRLSKSLKKSRSGNKKVFTPVQPELWKIRRKKLAYYGRKNKKGAFRFRGLKLKFTENEKKYTARASLKGFLANASHSLLTKTILPKAPLAFLNNFSRSYQTKTISKNLNRNSKANAFERLLKQKDYSKTSRAGKTKNRKRTRFLELLSKKSVLTKNAFKKALFAKVVALLKKQSSLRKKLRSQYSSTKQNSYSFLKYRTKRFKQLMRYNNTKQSRLFVSTFKRSLKKAYRVQKHLFQQRLLSVALNSNPSTWNLLRARSYIKVLKLGGPNSTALRVTIMRVRKKALRQLLQQKTLLGTLQSSNTTAKVLRSPKSKLFFHSISRKVLFRSAQNSLKGSDSATGLSYTVNKYVPVRTKTLINVRLLNAKSKASIKNRFYTRVYLRRRLRASLLLRRRLRLKRLSNLRWPQAYAVGAKRARLSKRAFRRKRRFEKRTLSRLYYPRVFAKSEQKLQHIPSNKNFFTNLKKTFSIRKQQFLKSIPRYTPVYRLLFRRWHSYRDKDGNPLPRTWPSRAEVRRLAALNRLRYRKGLRPKKRPDPVFNELEVTTGKPASIGYRRRRRVLISQFGLNKRQNLPSNYNLVFLPQSVSNFSAFKTKAITSTNTLSSLVNLRKDTKRFGSKRVSNWRSYLNSQQSLSPLQAYSASVTPLITNVTIWSLPRLTRIISSVAVSTGTWAKALQFFSPETVSLLRSEFIKRSAGWLSDRFSERQLYDKTQNFISASSSNDTRTLLVLNRAHLFNQQPTWWLDESKSRLNSLEHIIQNMKFSSDDKVSLVNKILAAHSTYHRGSEAVSVFFDSTRTKNTLKLFLKDSSKSACYDLIKRLTQSNGEEANSTLKNSLSTYQFWLRNVTTYTKKTTPFYSNKIAGSLDKNLSFYLESERPRFPGVGRRSNSYDRALRLFYRKNSLSRFRRVQKMRFLSLKPSMYQSSYSRLPLHESAGRQEFLKDKNTLAQTYASRNMRKLQNRRKSNVSLHNLNKYGSSKRRLASSPLRLVFSKALYSADKNSSTLATSNAEPLLLAALKSRMKLRQLQDLTLHAQRRLLPSEQILPPWIQARKLRKKQKARSAPTGEYFTTNLRDNNQSALWTVSNFSLTVAKNLVKESPDLVNFSGFTSEPLVYYRRKGLKVGYTTARSSRKIRRFARRRRYRRVLLKRSKLKKRKKFLRNRRRTKKHMSRSWRFLKRVTGRRLLQRKLKLKNSFGYRLLSESLRSNFTPLKFNKQTKVMVVSAQEKQRQSEGLESLKQMHYRKSAQLADSLLYMFPQLISLLVERQLTNKKYPSKAELKGMIHSIYWSLRFYLQTDVGGRRSGLRDTYLQQFTSLRSQLSRDSESRYFDASLFKNTRERYQPHRLHSVRSLRRGALDWLRMFFPRFHALYLEDSEEYHNFFLSAAQVTRAHPARTNPGNWSTNKIAGPMESKFKRLTNAKVRDNSSRFESLLISAKRSPVIAGYGAAVNVRNGRAINSALSGKASFFRRNYSTSLPLRAPTQFATALSRLVKVKRFVSSNDALLPEYKALGLKYQLSPRSNSKSSVNKAESSSEISLGSIDPRFLRLRSPRSGQFMQRLFNSNRVRNVRRSTPNVLSRFSNVHRTNRRSVLKTTASSYHPFKLFLRKRQQLSFLLSNSSITRKQRQSTRYLYTSDARAVRRNNKFIINWYSNLNSKSASSTFNSVLHRRHASQRLSSVQFNKTFRTPHKGVVLKPSVRNSLRNYNFNYAFLSKTYRLRTLRSKSWFQKNNARLRWSKLAKARKLLKLSAGVMSFSPRLTLTRKHSSLGYRHRYATANFTKLSVNKESYRPRSLFTSQSRRFYRNKKIISQFLVSKERRTLENPGSVRRKEIWNMLTLRWMKKRRVLKNWLKDAKRGLKRCKWRFMSELLFKGMRSRLRKLDWREPDDRFNRKGWRNAFRFYPSERRVAPWLEKLMYRRSLYNTVRGPYRRYQFPREQKRLKWLQNYRRIVFSSRRSSKYLKGRRWPKLRIYNQRLFRSFFSLKNKRVAQRHFKKLSRRKSALNGFSQSLKGLGDRLDVNLVLLNIAPTIFWAKVLATFGLFKINNKTVRDPSYRFKPNDRIFWNWALIERLRTHFQQPLMKHEVSPVCNTSATFPKNFEYYPKIHTAIYKGLPRAEDLFASSRLSPFLFKLFKAESGTGRQ